MFDNSNKIFIFIKYVNHHQLMANYDNIKNCLEENGEAMLRLDNNESIELHKHNVKFDDNSKEIIVDAGTETYWIGADKVTYYWIHKEGFSKE